MHTLFGPHMLKVPTERMISAQREWRLPVALLLIHVQQQPEQKDGLCLKPAPGESESESDRLKVLQASPHQHSEDATGECGAHVRPFRICTELQATRLIGRLFIADERVEAQIKADPVMTAEFHHHPVRAARNRLASKATKLVERVQYGMVANEILAGNKKDLRLLGQYERKRMVLAKGKTEEEGKRLYGCGLYALANGNPPLFGISTDKAQPDAGEEQPYDVDYGASKGFGVTALARCQDEDGNGMSKVLQKTNEYNAGADTDAHRHVLLLHQYFKPDSKKDPLDNAQASNVWLKGLESMPGPY